MPGPQLSRLSARSTMTLVSRQHLWPSNRKHPGLAHGWHGSAWLAFKLADAGIAVPDRVFDAVGRRLSAERGRASRTAHVGAYIGCAADAVIAAYAARHGVTSAAAARRACSAAATAARNSATWDVQMGLAGALLAFGEIAAVAPDALRDVPSGRLAARLLATVDVLCARPPRGWSTGMAHGPAGAIVAAESCGALGWCRVTTRRRQRWFDMLARSAVATSDSALLWPATAGQRALDLQSWCAGTPGIALALLQCFRLTGQSAYLEFARGALEGMKLLASKAFFSRTLCCGSAGYHHIFLEAHRITGQSAWLEQACRAARFSRSVRPRRRRGLLQGELGIAYLADRVANPRACPLPALGPSSA
jgi:hypothetical protein